jgi:glycosyltransferase involved in cell wall biosynthesis
LKKAVVMHPRFTEYGGGEVIALHVIKALQDSGFSVSFVSDNYNPAEVERNFGMGRVLEKASHIQVPPFRPMFRRFLALQHLRYASRVMKTVKDLDADVVFSTQSVLYYVPEKMTIHIVYDVADLFQILGGKEHGPLASFWKKPYYRALRKSARMDFRTNRLFIPLSKALEQKLSDFGYPHSPEVYPPCDMIFKPRTKKQQVCLVSRIAPQKNIQDFMEIARKVPEYQFILVAAESQSNPAFSRRILSLKSKNVDYIEARIRDRPDLLESSKVYLYTSLEPGIGIALGQAIGAGCIPVTPSFGGGAEMVAIANIGYKYDKTEEGASLVRKALNSRDPRDSPEHISETSKLFSSESFEQKIMDIARLQLAI